MTDWRSPSLGRAEYYAYVKLIHFLGGLYVWEILVNLDYDCSIFTRKRRFRASFLLYLLARWIPLINVIMVMAGQDSNARYLNCQVYVSFVYMLTYSGLLFASSLFVLRIVAIWERNKVVVTLASTTWLANFIACIYSAATTHSVWIEPLRICGSLDVLKTRISLVSIFTTEVVLLILMLTGLLRWKHHGKGSIWYLLFTQGVVSVAVAAFANIPPLIFIFLNLNTGMDVMSQVCGPFIMSIAAARMYRGLSDYLGRTDIFHSTHVLPASRQPNSRPFGKFVAPPSSDIVIISASGGIQSDAQVSDTGSLTVGSSDNAEKAASGGDETVWIV